MHDRAIEVLFIGSGTELELNLADKYNIQYRHIATGKYRRYSRGWKTELTDVKTNQKNIIDLVKFSRGYFQARKIIRQFKPDVVFTKGGYVSVPIGLAASSKKIPLIIHDSDAIFGMSTRILASKAHKIAIGFPKSVFQDYVFVDKLVFTGNPVRKELLSGSVKRAERVFMLDKTKPTIMLFGGSQGASALNSVIFAGLDLLLVDYNIIHHTGPDEIEQARIIAHKLPEKLKNRYRPYEFLRSEMTDALFLSDIAIIRPSASSIAEVAAHSKPTIAIASPFSANQHQQKNAEVLEKMGAIRVIDQAKLTPISLKSEIDRILSNDKTKKYLQSNIHKFWVPDAAEKIANLILNLGTNNKNVKT